MPAKKKARDFDGLWNECLSLIKANPMPLYPRLPLAFRPLTNAEVHSLSTGESRWGYPLTELFINEQVVRLLVQKNTRVKYEHYIRTDFLGVLRLLEESADLPVDYRISISEIINDPFFPGVNLRRSRAAMSEVKKFVRDYVGLEFERDTSGLRFVTRNSVMLSQYFYERNTYKSGSRAHALNQQAYTRLVLGDVELGRVPEDLPEQITRGVRSYETSVLGFPDKRRYVEPRSLPRHLL